MTDQTPPGSDYAAPAINSEPLSIRQASIALATERRAAPPPQDEQDTADTAAAEARAARDERGRFARAQADDGYTDTGDEPGNAAPDDQDPGDTQTEEVDPAHDEPPIEPPRSWTKEEKEAFKLLPREHQQRLSEHDRKRESEFRRGQNEVAEQRKAIEAELRQVQQQRQQYEAALPQLLGVLNARQANEFADIKSMDDVRRMAGEDPFRFAQWQAHRMEVENVQREMQRTQAMRAQEQQQQQLKLREEWAQFAQEQDRLFAEKAPEFRDPVKAEKAVSQARNYLTEIGFAEDELSASWEGQRGISLRDARIQAIIRDGMKFREAQRAAKTAAKPNTPPVQKPGTAPVSNRGARTADIEALSQKLDSGSGGIREKLAIAAELQRLKRAQGARRGA